MEEKMARVTLKMLSEYTGLAVSTISEILNGKPNFCSTETREYVLKTASELGYTPNLGFKLMTGRDTGTAAILYSQRRISFEEHNRALAMSLLEALDKLGRSAYTVVLSVDPKQNLQRIRELISRGCREFFFLGAPMGDKEIYALLDGEKFSRSHFNSYGATHNSIQIDYSFVAASFIDYYLERGIRPCLLFTRRHFERYGQTELLRRNLSTEEHFIEVCDLGHLQKDCFMLAYERALFAVENAISRFAAPVGWICMTDCDAMGVLAALNRAHLPAVYNGSPLVCGFGNSSYSKLSVQPVNSVDLKLEYVVRGMLSPRTGCEIYRPDIIFNDKEVKHE